MEKKAQIFSAELVIASALFIGALMLFVAIWAAMHSAYSEEKMEREMQTVLFGISDMLVLSPGEPSGWEQSEMENASAIGLATRSNRLSPTKFSKLESLNATNYQDIKESMGAGRFDIYIALNNSTALLYSFGISADLNNSTTLAISTERLVLMNDSIATLKVQVWGKKGRIL